MKNLKRDIEVVERWLDELVHRRLTDYQVLQGFILHYVILDIKNVNDNISRMNEKQVVKLTNSKVGKTDFRKLHNTGENFLTESGVYKLVCKETPIQQATL